MPPGLSLVHRSGVGLLAGALLALCACASPEHTANADVAMGAGGRITVVGPDPDFDAARLPAGWYALEVGGDAGTEFSLAEKQGVLALRLENEGGGALLGRHVRAPLLAMPYLRWGWHLESVGEQPQGQLLPDRPADLSVPLFLFVGFRGGAPGGQPAADWGNRAAGGNKPRFDRALVLAWGGNALTPVGLDAASAPPRLVLHEGLRDAGRWAMEVVDLSQLYARLWPLDRMGDAEVVFIATGAGPTSHRSVGYVAEVVLSK